MKQNSINKKYTIKVTVLIENSFWVGIFERNDSEGYAVARKIFGGEPTDPELYEFVLVHFDELKFTEPQEFQHGHFVCGFLSCADINFWPAHDRMAFFNG